MCKTHDPTHHDGVDMTIHWTLELNNRNCRCPSSLVVSSTCTQRFMIASHTAVLAYGRLVLGMNAVAWLMTVPVCRKVSFVNISNSVVSSNAAGVPQHVCKGFGATGV
jgi:hypothetical protein